MADMMAGSVSQVCNAAVRAPYRVFNPSLAEIKKTFDIIPKLSFKSHKGQAGRIAVIGGSADYTGAPFYAGMSSLRFGADLSFIFTSSSALIPIKSYSPELMVSSFYDDNQVSTLQELRRETASSSSKAEEYAQRTSEMALKIIDSFPRIHSLVIGPGLGRHDVVLDVVAIVIRRAREEKIPVVLDADALWLVANNISLVMGQENCILTPNLVEFDRLVKAAISYCDEKITTATATNSSGNGNGKQSVQHFEFLKSQLVSTQEPTRVWALCQVLDGVTILRKGPQDLISQGGDVYSLGFGGSPRRCGGQGDILAGCLGVSAYWGIRKMKEDPGFNFSFNQNLLDLLANPVNSTETTMTVTTESDSPSPSTSPSKSRIFILSTLLSAFVVREASFSAFQEKKRALTSPDIIDHLGRVFPDIQL